MSDLIAADNLTVTLGQRTVLQNVSLSIASGEIVTIVGPNGSGKSTLLRAMIGALKPSGGQVTRQRKLRIGYVPQKLQMDGTMPLTVWRFLTMRCPATAARFAMEETGVADLDDRQMADLSGGQFQRVLLARALTLQPEILILDEPTQGLDQPGSASFYRLIESLRTKTGCAVVMVSHDLHVVMSASDRVICLNGHICCEGAPSAVSTAPEYRALFGHGTGGALALYQHEHDHHHDHDHGAGTSGAGMGA
ncbi:MAG: metal ABC transporter ATP-binding protein [Pseudomonadota bacterium]